MPENTKPVGKITVVSPESISAPVSTPVGKITPVGNVPVATKGFDPLALTPEEQKMKAIGEEVDKLSFTEGYNEDEKKYLIDLAKKSPSYDVWNNAKKTMGGEHPKQEGQQTYYFDEIGYPVPLAQNEKAPAGKNVESVWGSQASAEGDSIMTTVGKNLANTIPNFIQSFGDLAHLPYGLATGKEADWYKDLKNEVATHKLATSSASQESFLDISNVHNFEDLAKAENWSFTPENVAGNVSQLASTVLQFVGGSGIAKGIGLGAKAAGLVEAAEVAGVEVGIGTKALSKLPYLASSYTNNLATSLEASDAAGVTGREKYAIASLVTLPVSAVETFMGLTGKIANNPALKAERDQMVKALVKGWKEEGGQMTKESLKELYDATIVASSSVMGKMAKEAAKNSLGEASEEVLQNVIQKSSESIYDHMFAQDKEIGKGKYGTDVTSPQAFAEYINDAVAGALGGGIGGAGIDKYRRAKAEIQSANAYDYIKQGETAVQGLKASIARSRDNGSISPDEYKKAIFKIDTYQKYYDQVKDLNLDDKANRRVSDLTWSNENLKLQQESLMQNQESKVKGTIPHRRLLDTEAILEANSKEMSLLMSQKIADQQTAVALTVDEKIAGEKKEVLKDQAKASEAIPLKEQIKVAETEKDLDAFLNEADNKGLTTPELIDLVGQKREQIKAQPPVVPVVEKPAAEEKVIAPEHKEFVKFTETKFKPEVDFNNLKNVSNSEKADAIVEYLDQKGERDLKGGTIQLGRYANKVSNGVLHPLYYAVNFSGKEVKFASGAYTKFIKEKNLVDRPVTVQLIKPEDADLAELVKQDIIEPHEVVERTDADGNKSKSFVFRDDENKVRHPYILVARALTKAGKPGVKIANMAISDYGKAGKRGREGVRMKQKPTEMKVLYGRMENKSSEKKVVGESKFDKESAQIDYEAQLEGAESIASPKTIDEEEGFTVKEELLNDYKLYEDDTENENAVEQIPTRDDAESEASIKDIESQAENAGSASQEEIEQGIKEVDALLDKVRKYYSVKLPFAFDKAMKHDVTSAYDQVLQYFIGGGKINAAAIEELYGGKGRESKVESEINARKGYLNTSPLSKKTDVAIDGLAHSMWQGQNLTDQYDTQDFVDAISEVIGDFNTRTEMADYLNDAFKEKKESSEPSSELKEEETKKSKHKLEDDEEFPITPSDQEPHPFQKISEMAPEEKAIRDKKIELLKKSLPGIKVVEDNTIGDIMGQLDADGKTIRLNPDYNFSDTPIHEFGHALIDILGGTKNALVVKGIEQLKDSKLWKETKERYPELSEDMLAKEVLAEAIGREGVGVFETKEKQSKFKNWLDGIFYKLKRLLGIEKNIAKNLASQLLSGKRISGKTVSTKEVQKQKDKEVKTITSVKAQSYKKWLEAQGKDEFSTKERIVDVKEEIESAEGKEKEILEGELELLENSLASYKEDYQNYVADHKAIVEFIESKGDISQLTLEELNEIRSQMSKYDDIIKTKIYKDLLYNIGVKTNEIQTEGLKAADPNYNPEVEQKGDMSKSDIWSQGLSTIGEKFPAIQAFYKQYRSASGDMKRELSTLQQEAQKLGRNVIKEYQKEHGVAERLKNFTTGAGNKYFSFLAKDGKLIEKDSKEYNKLSKAQKELLDFITEKKANLDEYMDDGGVLLKSGAGFLETFNKSGIFKAYANYITNNHNIRNVKVQFKHPVTGNVTEEYYGDVENILSEYAKKGGIAKMHAAALLTKYNLQARKGLETKKGSKGKYFLKPDGKLVSMFGGEFKGDFTEDYYESFMKYAQDAIFSKNMSPLMPTLTGVEMFYKSMGSDKENVVKFLDVVKKGKFLRETIESGLGEKGDAALRALRKWTSWRFIAFNIPANIWNVAVGEYNQFRADGAKAYVKGKKRLLGGLLRGKKNAKALNILKKYNPDLVTDTESINPEKHLGKYFDMLAFGGQKVGEALIRGSAIIGRMSTEHYNWMDSKGNVTGNSPEQIKYREGVIQKEMDKYAAEVEKVQGRYSDTEKRNFAYFELGQFFGQFKVWMPEWLSDRFSREYIDADGVKHKGSFNTLWSYGLRDFMRDATKKEFYTSSDPKHVAARKQLRGMIITAGLLSAYLGSSDDDDDKEYANQLDKALRNISGIYRMDNNTFLVSQPAAAMSAVVDLAKITDAAITGKRIKSGKNKGDIKALDMAFNMVPGNKLISTPVEYLSDSE